MNWDPDWNCIAPTDVNSMSAPPLTGVAVGAGDASDLAAVAAAVRGGAAAAAVRDDARADRDVAVQRPDSEGVGIPAIERDEPAAAVERRPGAHLDRIERAVARHEDRAGRAELDVTAVAARRLRGAAVRLQVGVVGGVERDAAAGRAAREAEEVLAGVEAEGA